MKLKEKEDENESAEACVLRDNLYGNIELFASSVKKIKDGYIDPEVITVIPIFYIFLTSQVLIP